MRKLTSIAVLCYMVLGCGDEDPPASPDTDAGSRDAGAAMDTGGRPDARPAPDTGTATDTGVPTDTGTGTDTGSATDAGTVADTGGATDAGADTGAGPDSGTDAGEPPPTGDCAMFSNSEVLAAVYGEDIVPPGSIYFTEPTEESAYPLWEEPCSPDLATTHARALELLPDATFLSERVGSYFFEVDLMSFGYVVHYRNTQCPYFDGTTLAGGPHSSVTALDFLAGYLWYVQSFNIGGYRILGAKVERDSPPFEVILCTTQFVGGDFGLCDTATVIATRYEMTADGAVTIGSATPEREIMGDCH